LLDNENRFHYCRTITMLTLRCSPRAPLRALALCLLPACGDDAPADDEAADTADTGTTETPTGGPPASDTGLDSGTGTTTEGPDDGTTTGTGDETGEPGHELGSTPNVLCEAAALQLQIIIDENASGAPDLATVTAAYLGEAGDGTALQQLVQTWGGRLGRVEDGVLVDEAAILDALEAGTPADLVDVETRVYLVVSLLIRARIDEVATALPEADRPPELLYAAWDDAYCWFDAVVRPHAQAADALAAELEPTEADMQHGFEWGHGGIESDAASFAIDEWSVPAAKQVIEKSLFRVYDRRLLDLAARAQAEDDPLMARRALGLFQLLEDRLVGRNTPGIAIIEADLSGDPALIDAGSIRRELDVAWSKRTRRYSTLALEEGTLGTPAGHTGANEGRTYSKAILPAMQAQLPDFDGADHLAQWDAYLQAIIDDDPVAAQAASDALTPPLCDYQALLGIAACTGTEDEPAPGG
jgi:hypothetical protein